MMEKNNSFERFDEMVDKFLRRQMTPSEEQAFRDELASNPALTQRAQAIALMIKSMDAVGAERDRQIADEIKGMSETEFRRAAGLKPRAKTNVFRPKFIRYAAAACVAGVICWAAIHYYGVHQTVVLGTSADYYAYSMDIADDANSRGMDDQEVTLRLTTLFDNVRDGIDLPAAISELEKIYSDALDPNSNYAQYDNDIAWNLAFAYLKEGQRAPAATILQAMIDRNHDYPDITGPAQALLDRINSL